MSSKRLLEDPLMFAILIEEVNEGSREERSVVNGASTITDVG